MCHIQSINITRSLFSDIKHRLNNFQHVLGAHVEYESMTGAMQSSKFDVDLVDMGCASLATYHSQLRDRDHYEPREDGTHLKHYQMSNDLYFR